MPTGLKRYYGKGDLHFVTFSCYRRLSLLASEHARNLFVKELARVRREYGFHFGRLCRDAKSCALADERAEERDAVDGDTDAEAKTRRMRKQRKRNSEQREIRFDEEGLELKSFWQERFYDFNVYKSGKVKEKLNYMHANPVIRGLVKHPI